MSALAAAALAVASPPVRCVTDAKDTFRAELRTGVGCSSVLWAERLAEALPRTAPVTLVNVGANKGYRAPEFLALWSDRRFDGHLRGWQRHVIAYAKEQHSSQLTRYSCGNCNDCRASSPSPHKRTGARVHLLEIAPVNQALLRYVVGASGVGDVVTLHDVGASNVSSHVPIGRDTPVGDERQGILGVKKAKRFARSNASIEVAVVALDDFLAAQRLQHVYHVAIDTEGWDALVLEGMHATIARRAVSLIEFEVSRAGFWGRFNPERRKITDALDKLEDAGYACFWELPSTMIPASRACWRPPNVPWSNVVCAHEPEMVAALDELSFAAYTARQQAHMTARSGATKPAGAPPSD
jgi:FkbM family methyltransferase